MMSVYGLDPCMYYLFGLTDYKLIKTKVPIKVLFMVQSINILFTDNVCDIDIPAQLSFEHFIYFLFYIP